MACHNQQHLIELDGNKPTDVLLAVSSLCSVFLAEVVCKTV